MSIFNLKIDEELLQLGAVAIDDSIKPVLQNLLNGRDKVEFSNEKDETRVFNINWSDGLIEGRGIKGFFSSGVESTTFVELKENQSLGVYFYDKQKPNFLKNSNLLSNEKEFMEIILKKMITQISDREELFHSFENAKRYSSTSNFQELVCLSHLREMEIFEYQVKTVKSVLDKLHGRVLLCDEVGLGKTVEACMAMVEYIMRGLVKKILILVPPSLVEQWNNELKRKFNQDFICYDDPEFKKHGEQGWKNFNKVIASISTAKRKPNADLIAAVQYDLIIVDEAHHLKNRKTLTWQFVNSLNKKYIFLLTATPVQNNLEELYNLITLLKPGQLKTYSYFKKQFVANNEGMEVKNINQLKDLISGVMIRNRRSDVDIKFTKRFASTHSISLLKEEEKLYEDISCFIRDKYNCSHPVLSRFVLKNLQEEMGSSFVVVNSTLEKLIANEKLSLIDKEALTDFLLRSRDIIKNNKNISTKLLSVYKIITDFNDKMIIFTKYKLTQSLIVEFLKSNGIKVSQFHGGLSRKEKEEQIIMFQQEAQVLISTEAGGEGRNLQFCSGMINFDLPWNPMSIEQRIGRIHRIGQTKDVYVYNLAATNTVEYYILDLLDKKINMFELVVGEVDLILGDIEEDTDFSDIIMNAWTTSHDMNEIKKQIDILGDKMLENKRQYLKIKELDDDLFGENV